MKRGMLKIDKILNFQGSLFCGFIDIKAKTDIILELLTNLQKEVLVQKMVPNCRFAQSEKRKNNISQMRLGSVGRQK